MTDKGLFTIRYSCRDTYEYPAEASTKEAMRALYRVPCPECRQHPSVRHRYFPSPAEPGATYQFFVEASDGAPLTAEHFDHLYLCEEHEQEAVGKAVPTPPGVARHVGVIIGRGLCDLCSGTIAIGKVATSGQKAKHIELPYDCEDGIINSGEWKILSPTEAQQFKRASRRRAIRAVRPDDSETRREHSGQTLSEAAPVPPVIKGRGTEEDA